jgi:hypothetical protein
MGNPRKDYTMPRCGKRGAERPGAKSQCDYPLTVGRRSSHALRSVTRYETGGFVFRKDVIRPCVYQMMFSNV